jgi:hypothetical protein
MDKTTTTMSNEEIESYLKSLDALEKKTLDIAKSHLGTSFNVRKSIGFIKWKQAIVETK